MYRRNVQGQEKRRKAAIVAAVLFLALVVVVSLSLPRLKVGCVETARFALASARQQNANLYAPRQFRPADSLWNRMLAKWHNENGRFILLRNYRQISEMAIAVESLANLSQRTGSAARDSLYRLAQARSNDVHRLMSEFKCKVGFMPMSNGLYRSIMQSQLLEIEGKEALRRKEYLQACCRLEKALLLINDVSIIMYGTMAAYLENTSRWVGWSKQTIAWSAKYRRWAIVVDKLAHLCALYNSGKLVSLFPIELGANWIGDKYRMGDRATPEGRYFIRKKKGRGQTSYYRALEIDYPNAGDQKAFNDAKKNWTPATYTGIGGHIEIHGNGGKNCNWTDGCIALKDADMDTLFRMVDVGTPVTIVGTSGNAAGR
jgi:lipoprotein-anchoring transpeptidase ErfK/SrfK